MNKTLSIGLAGFSFTIEEHAYIKLKDYLAALRNTLDASEADEVMQDIEIRMVEIFKETLGKREVINDDDVEKVIHQIGKPEQIEEQEETYYTDEKPKSTSYHRQKQLFRDPEKAKIAGVCAGLAHYVGIDITFMRLIWVAFFIVLFPLPGNPMLMILLYIILWIVVPQAETASDFLRMKGKPINFDNLKHESNKIVKFANESTRKVGEIYEDNKPFISNAGNGIWDVLRYILGTFFAILGLSLLLGSFSIFGIAGYSGIQFFDNLGFYLQDQNLGFLVIAISFLTLFIPALIFCYLAMKLFSPKTTLQNTGYVIGGLVLLWIALAAITGFSFIKYKTQYSGENDEEENVSISTPSDSILIDTKKVVIPQNFESFWDDVYSDKKTVFKKDYPYVNVKREDIKTPYLVIKKQADGYNLPLKTNVPVEIIGNKILLPNYFSYPYEYRFRDYNVEYDLVVPKYLKVISLNEDNLGISDDQDDDQQNSSNNQNGVTVNTNGNSIVYSSNLKDSVIINGKKYPEKEADKILDTMKTSLDKLKDVNIKIKNGEKEVSIKTN